jgi:HD-like signal output (HDOD) protein
MLKASAMTTMRSSFAEIIEGIHTIPSLPEIASRVARMAGDPATTIPMIAEVIVKDAGMAAKMLRLVNSAVYALREPVNSLDQALGLLGYSTIRSIALSVSVVSLFQQEQAQFNMKAYWLHSAVAAGMCRAVARLNHCCDPEHAFTFGLLKDIGKVILVENAPEETRTIIGIAQERRLSFTAAARTLLETDDAEIAAWLCQTWELDTDLVNAIRFQHDLVHASQPVMTAMGMMVDHLCALRGIRTSGSCDAPVLDAQVWHHLGLDKGSFKAVIAGMNSDIAAARELLAIAG